MERRIRAEDSQVKNFESPRLYSRKRYLELFKMIVDENNGLKQAASASIFWNLNFPSSRYLNYLRRVRVLRLDGCTMTRRVLELILAAVEPTVEVLGLTMLRIINQSLGSVSASNTFFIFFLRAYLRWEKLKVLKVSHSIGED